MDGAGVGFAGAGGEVSPGKRAEGKTEGVRAADERGTAGVVRDGGSGAAGACSAEMRCGVRERFACGAVGGCVDCACAGTGRLGSGGGSRGGGETFAGDGFGEATDCADGAGGVEGGGIAAAGRGSAGSSGFGLVGYSFCGRRTAGLAIGGQFKEPE